MVVVDDRHHREGKLDRGQDICADRDVPLHHFELGRRELTRLIENVFGDADLSDIVQERGRLERLKRGLIVGPEISSKGEAIALYAADVAVRHLILGIDRRCERFNRRLVHPVQFVQMPHLIAQAVDRSTKRHVENDRNGSDHQQSGQTEAMDTKRN